MMRGLPDMSAQLFTALCRSLGLPARLVVSIQAVLWRKEKGVKERAIDRAIQKSKKSMKEKDRAPSITITITKKNNLIVIVIVIVIV